MLIGWLLLGACWDALLAVRLALVAQDDLLGCFAETLCWPACKLDVGSESEQQYELDLDLNLHLDLNVDLNMDMNLNKDLNLQFDVGYESGSDSE